MNKYLFTATIMQRLEGAGVETGQGSERGLLTETAVNDIADAIFPFVAQELAVAHAIADEAIRGDRAIRAESMTPRQPMPIRSVRVADNVWTAAQTKADERNENLSEVIRRALERYLKAK